MKCDKCKKEFNPRIEWSEGNKITRGYGEVLEITINCPHCKAFYSHWVEPRDWFVQEEG